jgi:hypothetical protein
MRGEIVLLPEENQSERRRSPPPGRNFGDPVSVGFPAGGGHGSPAHGGFILRPAGPAAAAVPRVSWLAGSTGEGAGGSDPWPEQDGPPLISSSGSHSSKG